MFIDSNELIQKEIDVIYYFVYLFIYLKSTGIIKYVNPLCLYFLIRTHITVLLYTRYYGTVPNESSSCYRLT